MESHPVVLRNFWLCAWGLLLKVLVGSSDYQGPNWGFPLSYLFLTLIHFYKEVTLILSVSNVANVTNVLNCTSLFMFN